MEVYATEESAAQARMNREAVIRNGGHTVKLHFGVDIQQTDERTVEIIVAPAPYKHFTAAFEESVYKAMGTIRGEAFLEELTIEINKRAILDGITMR